METGLNKSEGLEGALEVKDEPVGRDNRVEVGLVDSVALLEAVGAD